MAIQSQPSRISEPFAGSGTKNTIPATNTAPSASQAASWASGFPPECSQPISAGGCPVPRDDFNGILNQLSQDFSFRQDGGVWGWSALADYDIGRIVRGSDGLLYQSTAQSGPGLAAGAQNPVADNGTYWTSPKVKTVSATDSSNAAASTDWVRLWDTAVTLPSIFYIDSVNGSDSNSGTSPGNAKKTWGAVRAIIQNSAHRSSIDYTVKFAAGSYGRLELLCGVPLIFDFSSGSECADIFLGQGCLLKLSGAVSISGSLISSRGSVVELLDGLSVTFDDTSRELGIDVRQGGIISKGNNAVCTFTFSNPVFSIATVRVFDGGLFVCSGTKVVWSGSATGKRYSVYAGGVLSNIGSTTAIPGSPSPAGDGTVDSSSFFS